MAANGFDDRLMNELNTTPLIDVMLVLLVMFIITVPIQTHAVRIDLPSGPPPVDLRNDRNKLVVTAGGALLWNGATLTMPQLQSTLHRMGAMQRPPELHFQPDAEARYALVDEVLAAIKRANVATMGFVGNERYHSF